MSEESIIQWGRQLGYGAADKQPLVKSSIAKLCKGQNRKAWEFLIEHFHAKQHVKATRAKVEEARGSGVHDAAMLASSRLELRLQSSRNQLQLRCTKLTKLWDGQTVSVQES